MSCIGRLTIQAEAQEHTGQGHCVAVDAGLARPQGDVTGTPVRKDGMELGLIDITHSGS
jgi:hypothetical protein